MYRRARGPIVIDTDVYGAGLVRSSKLGAAYEPVIVGRPAFISFQTRGRIALWRHPAELGTGSLAEHRDGWAH